MDFEDDGFAAFSSTNTMDRIPCGICGRGFAPEVLDRHTPICQKSAMKKRKVFDSAKMRAEGTEMASVKPGRFSGGGGAGGRRAAQRAEPTPKKSNWRQKHEDFIRSIRGAKQAQDAIAQGKPLPPPPAPTINPDYVQCDYCGRRFNETAAERHIPFCREKNQRLGGGGGGAPTRTRPGQSRAAEKQAKRTQYQPPKLKSKTSSPGVAGTSTGRNTNHSNSRIGSAGLRTAPLSAGATRTTPSGGAGRGARNSGYGKGSPVTSPSRDYSPSLGGALRTGRTNNDYDDAREFSAKQRSGLPRNKYHSNDSVSKYANQTFDDLLDSIIRFGVNGDGHKQ